MAFILDSATVESENSAGNSSGIVNMGNMVKN